MVTVVMVQNDRGEDGTTWKQGNSYPASMPYAKFLIGKGSAYADDASLPDIGLTAEQVSATQALVSGDWIPQPETAFPDEVVRMSASGGVCGVPCYVSRIRCVTGTAVALTVYEGAASTATTLLTATMSAGDEATIPGGRLRAINGVRAVFASGSFDFYIGTE